MAIALLPLSTFVLSGVFTPGPANMLMLANGAQHGFRAALPFTAGVALSKQFIIWPIGFGLAAVLEQAPWVFATLRWAALAYILYLAWKIAGARITRSELSGPAPSFWQGLLVHPVNPKAWALVISCFTIFAPGEDPLRETATIAAVLFVAQAILHPLWTFGGDLIARTIAGTRAERAVMLALAVLTVASVVYALFVTGL